MLTPPALAATVRTLAAELGFTGLGVSGVDLAQAEQRLADWLARGYHGEMAWMARHGSRRSRPAELVPGTLRVICVRMDYWPQQAAAPWPVLESPSLGYVSRYALGRDYHKRVRQRLQRLADGIAALIGPFGYRVFCDSAPVLEKPLAEQAGLGWIGKHTCLIDRRGGSWFFLGELYTDLPLPVDAPARGHCGSCRACMDVCPTGAIVAPYVVDARRCISYLTIEQRADPAPELAAAFEGWAFGCDICNTVCPWNVKFAAPTAVEEFADRGDPDRRDPSVFETMDDATFRRRYADTPLARPGLDRMRRNVRLAVASRTSRSVP